MKGNKTKNSESTKGIVIHDVKMLTRKAIHLQKEKSETNLYPSDEIAEDLEDRSSDSDGSPYKKSSTTSDISPEKPEIRCRPGKKITSDESSETASKANKNQWDIKQTILFILGCLICVILVYLWRVFPRTATKDSVDIENIMNVLEKKFPTQPHITFRIVNSELKRAVSDSGRPGILVLLASEEEKPIRNEFASRLANALPESPVVINFNSLKSPEELKKDIDDTIKKNLSENELKAVIVKNLDHLPFDAAMIFHSYCDHENAPFKRALYIMTITSDEQIQTSFTSKNFDVLASQRLNSVWENSGVDQVSSLISRLTGSVAGITPENP